jgi:CelD/BcsL family acetyltransferase involved in cellulose biosynthesis
MTFDVRIVRETTELARLEPAWRALWERTPDATPFQHPAWLTPCWQHLPKGALTVFVAERDGQVQGILPLCLIAWGENRVLLPLGFDVSDYAEPLIAPDDPESTTAALLQALAETPGWSACEFVLREGTPFFRPPDGCGLQIRRTFLEAAPVLDLANGYPESLPPGIRRSLFEAERRSRKLGGVSFESATPETASAFLDRLFDLHRRRWRERGSNGVLSHPAVQAFHREAAARLSAAGLLRLTLMQIGGRDAAVLYAFAAKGRTCYYIGGFDPDYAAASPGSLIVAYAVERAASEGCRIFDFLKGQEAYKYRWGAADRGRVGYQVERVGEEQ